MYERVTSTMMPRYDTGSLPLNFRLFQVYKDDMSGEILGYRLQMNIAFGLWWTDSSKLGGTGNKRKKCTKEYSDFLHEDFRIFSSILLAINYARRYNEYANNLVKAVTKF